MSKSAFPRMEKPVVAIPRNEVEMGMELGLVGVFPDVGEHVKSLGVEHFKKRSTNSLSGFDEGNAFVWLNVKKVVTMLLRDDQAVPARHRQQIHEHQNEVVLIQNLGLHGLGDDAAECAARLAELPSELFFREEPAGGD